MAGPVLNEVVLLGCNFAALRDDHDSPPEPYVEDERGYVHEVEGVSIRYSAVDDDEGELVLFTELRLIGPDHPYELDLLVGSKFDQPDPPLTPERAVHTLFFITYPYLRELTSSITGRSPYDPLWLPPLTKLPVRKVQGAED